MNQFENDPRLKNLMPLKRQIILELANGSHNATMEQMLPQIMQLNRELQKRNLSFSKEESNLIMDIMISTFFELPNSSHNMRIPSIRSTCLCCFFRQINKQLCLPCRHTAYLLDRFISSQCLQFFPVHKFLLRYCQSACLR